MDPTETKRLQRQVRDLEAGTKIYHAHVENLIERVYELEQIIEVVVSRLVAVERATPLIGPKPKKAPPRLPPRSRPVR